MGEGRGAQGWGPPLVHPPWGSLGGGEGHPESKAAPGGGAGGGSPVWSIPAGGEPGRGRIEPLEQEQPWGGHRGARGGQGGTRRHEAAVQRVLLASIIHGGCGRRRRTRRWGGGHGGAWGVPLPFQPLGQAGDPPPPPPWASSSSPPAPQSLHPPRGPPSTRCVPGVGAQPGHPRGSGTPPLSPPPHDLLREWLLQPRSCRPPARMNK